ncbi:MAG: CHAT domain-containing protein [Longimicrobiaceae bacterium]
MLRPPRRTAGAGHPLPRWLPRGALALVLCAAALAQVQRVRARDADRPRGLLRALAGELGSVRSVAARLSVGDGYRPCAARPAAEPGMPDMACAAAPGWTPSRRAARVALAASPADRARADPEAVHALAVVDLLAAGGAGNAVERSIQSLYTVTRTSNRPAAAWADLSAAYLIRAEHAGSPRDLLSAVEAAERALEHAPRNRSALYNRALALQRFGVADVAARAWREYLAVDAASPWAAEARRRLAVATAGPVSPAPPPARNAPPEAWTAYARADPEATRLLGQDRLLGDWGAAVLSGDTARAARSLLQAAALGEALRQRPGGDQTLWDQVQAIRVRGKGAGLLALATAHREYAIGHALYDSVKYVAAEPRLRGAAAAGSPALALWAELYLANLRVYQGDVRGGEDRLLALAERTDTLRYTALAGRERWAIAAARMKGDRYEVALDPAEASARLFERAGERENAATILSGLANAQVVLGDPDAGYATWHRAMAALRPYRSSTRLHGTLVAIARVVADDGLPRAALRLMDESVEVTRRRGEPAYAAEARVARARLLPALGAPAGARADLDWARAALRRAGPDAGLGWVDADLQQAEGIASLFARPARPRQAAAALDSAAAYFAGHGVPFRGFSAVVSAAEARLAMGDLPGATQRLETALGMLELRRDSIRVEPRRAAVFDDARGVVDRMVLLHLAAGRVARALEILDRGRASLAPAASEPAGRAGPLAGPPGEVGIEYTLVADTLLAWTASGGRVALARTVVDTVRLARTVARLQQLLRDGRDEAAVTSLLEQLHEWLLRPVQARLGPPETPLVVVADGALAQVPFAALRDPRRGRYLVQDHPLRFGVSLREAWKPRRAVRPGGAAVVADPAFDPAEHPGLGPLPGAAAEAESIAREYGGARLLSGPAATRDAVQQALRSAGVVHYAGHAVFDDERPERSYLVLAPGAGGRGTGRLTARGLGEMRLEGAPLVVLAACRTVNAGRGRADGFSGLAGGLLAAGAGGVVGGLWEVDDATTRPLMLAFHHAYRREGDGARALRAAQLRLLASADPALRSPAAWAGFRYAGQ